jgi:hypothetical protein
VWDLVQAHVPSRLMQEPAADQRSSPDWPAVIVADKDTDARIPCYLDRLQVRKLKLVEAARDRPLVVPACAC